jgi:molybdopterin-guanine dinucleotide biosynthesis protein A
LAEAPGVAFMAKSSAGITGIVLCGGRGTRMGGVDKGLKPLRGRAMVEWVLERLVPQVDEVLINANQNPDVYGQLGHRVIPDVIGGFAGPLAGLHRGLREATHELVATVPCDSPFLPTDLIARLRAALDQQEAEIAVAKTGDQPHPVFCLCRKGVGPSLGDFLAGGGRKIDAWYSRLKVVEVLFDDQPDAFSNINTEEELRSHESR